MVKYNPKIGDIVTIPDSAERWMILAAAPGATGVPCNCTKPRWQRMKWRGNSQYESHTEGCPSFRKSGYYWLQSVTTGLFYRPQGDDEAVHRSALTLVTAHSLPSKRELLA